MKAIKNKKQIFKLIICISILIMVHGCQSESNEAIDFRNYIALQENIVDREDYLRGIMQENIEIKGELEQLQSQLILMSAQDRKPRPLRTGEQANPKDRVRDEQIRVYYHSVTLDIQGVQQTYLLDSNSMDPLLDQGTTVLSVKPKSVDDISIGDIVIFKAENSQVPIVHRVVSMEADSEGAFFITKGDNNPEEDPYMVRFNDLIAVVIGILY